MINIILNRISQGKFVLIGEIGVNYYDIALKMKTEPLEAAKLMVKCAKTAGIHSVKFQSYKAGTLAAKESPSYWDLTEEPTSTQYELFKKFDKFGEKEFAELASYCNEIGIEFLSTPFDIASVDYLIPMINLYKISSSDISNLPFIKYIAQKGKPIILSVGASDLSEITTAVNTIYNVNALCQIILLHCVLEYPTPIEHVNLRKITILKQQFPDLVIGYSDHTKPTNDYQVIRSAYILGASVIEKHFTLDKNLSGNDHYHAMDPDDAVKILHCIKNEEIILGSGEIKCLDSEKNARLNARRSVVSACNIKKGTVISKEMLTCKRPGTGIPASDFENVLGKTASISIEEDTVLQWDMFI